MATTIFILVGAPCWPRGERGATGKVIAIGGGLAKGATLRPWVSLKSDAEVAGSTLFCALRGGWR